MPGIKYKGTDRQWHLLNNVMVNAIDVVQTTGTSTADVMSQSAVTEEVVNVSNAITTHTNNGGIHLTQTEKDNIDSLTGHVGTMAYEDKTSYSSATEISNALNGKANTATTISAGDGLSGGGDLSTNITISLEMPTTYSAETYTSSTITSSEPIVYCLVRFASNLTNQVCPVDNLADGQQCNVIYNNTGATGTSYTVVISTTYMSPTGGAVTYPEVKLTIKGNGYGEVNYINIKGTIFVRGV